MPKMRPIRDRYLNVAQPPASTFVVVSRLMRPSWLIEIECSNRRLSQPSAAASWPLRGEDTRSRERRKSEALERRLAMECQ